MVVLSLLVARAASADEPLAPPAAPGIRSLYIPGLPFLHFGPLRPTVATGLEVAFETANTFSHSWHAGAIQTENGTLGQPFLRSEAEELHRRHPEDTIYFIDGDVTRVLALASLRLGRGFSAGVEIPWISFDAIHLDAFIASFHRAFGLPDSQRPAFPPNRFLLVLQPPNGPLAFYDRTPSAGLGDVVTTLSWRGGTPGHWRLDADVALKIPTGNADELRGSGSVDAGLLAGASRAFGRGERWTLRVEGGVVFPGPWHGALILPLRPSAFFRLMAAGQVRLGSRTWISLAATGEQSPFHGENLHDVGQTAGTVSLGIARHISTRTLFELWLTEHVSRFGDTADVAFGLRMRYAPGR